MVTLTIDGRPVSVEDGTTILDAARSVGIRIPTLCKVDGYPAAASCFLCAVKVENKATLTPSCAVPVAPAWWSTPTPTRCARRARWRSNSCCPTTSATASARARPRARPGSTSPGSSRGSSTATSAQAAAMASDFLTLPAALGRVCPRLCEQRCNRCDAGEAVSIGVAPPVRRGRRPRVARRATCRDARPATGKRVPIVGAGPAGLTAAYHLLRRGHDVTLLDAHDEPGGMLRYGIPAFRLPPDVLAKEIAVIAALGGRVPDGDAARARRQPRRRFAASRTPCSSRSARRPREGSTARARSSRRRPSRCSRRSPRAAGRRSAIACSSSAAGTPRWTSRAPRFGLGAQVTVLYRRTRREMPCLMAEVEAAEAEGVQRRAPRRAGSPRAHGRRAPADLPAHDARQARPAGAAASRARSRIRVHDRGDGRRVRRRARSWKRAPVEAGGLRMSPRGIAVEPRDAGHEPRRRVRRRRRRDRRRPRGARGGGRQAGGRRPSTSTWRAGRWWGIPRWSRS